MIGPCHGRAAALRKRETREMNGYRRRKVSCGVGSSETEYPKVRDTQAPFYSIVVNA